MIPVRAAVVLAIVVVVLLLTRLYRQWRHGVITDDAPVPRLPDELLDGAARTWVIFTTPWCASCGPVSDRLRTYDPEARLVTIDATQQPSLADAFRVRSAPTALLASHDGTVLARLVGADSVSDYVRSPA